MMVRKALGRPGRSGRLRPPQLSSTQAAFLFAARLSLLSRGRTLEGEYVGRAIFSGLLDSVGLITAVGGGYCGLEGCTGQRLFVIWEDGHRTRPCTKGCDYDSDSGFWKIGTWRDA